jgi:hypothetical protein
MRVRRLYLDEGFVLDMSELEKITDVERIEELDNIGGPEEFDSIFRVHYPLGITSIPFFNEYEGTTERVLYKNLTVID